MEVVYPCCCGLDVHKASITACVLWAEGGGRARKEKRRFGTFTRDLLDLADWLRTCGVTHVAMEATGVYWKPVWNILDGQFTEVLLVNAQHIKAVPGRKTDQKTVSGSPICSSTDCCAGASCRRNRHGSSVISLGIASAWRRSAIASRIAFRR